jgi:hypothetical protein
MTIFHVMGPRIAHCSVYIEDAHQPMCAVRTNFGLLWSAEFPSAGRWGSSRCKVAVARGTTSGGTLVSHKCLTVKMLHQTRNGGKCRKVRVEIGLCPAWPYLLYTRTRTCQARTGQIWSQTIAKAIVCACVQAPPVPTRRCLPFTRGRTGTCSQ